jgi:hypothetical protein
MRQAMVRAGAKADVSPQPNDVDRKRIERALRARRRYRYVSPSVRPIEHGYCIESPCCSRNVDHAGGVVGVAQLVYQPERRTWRLDRRDHERQVWLAYAEFMALSAALEVLNYDLEKVFWQ